MNKGVSVILSTPATSKFTYHVWYNTVLDWAQERGIEIAIDKQWTNWIEQHDYTVVVMWYLHLTVPDEHAKLLLLMRFS